MRTAQGVLAGACVLACLATGALAEVPVVTNVVAQQRTDTKLVDIHYDVFDADGDLLKIRVEVSDNGGTRYSVPAFSYTGDIGENISTGANKHIVWDAGVDWDGEYSDEMRVKVIAVDGKGYPGMEWGNEIPPGGFLMGRDGGAEGSGPSRHVNIPWSYWLSKYEVTAEQYCDFVNIAVAAGWAYRVGTTEVRAEVGRYAGVPGGVQLITLNSSSSFIRWNVNNFEVVVGRSDHPVSCSWYGAMAFAKHYGYDLPTTAEWEKAARGPDHDDEDQHFVYPWGDSIHGGLANYSSSGDPYAPGTTPVGYFDGNQTPFGGDMVSDYGLYDLAGNVSEWCRSKPIDTEIYPQQDSLTNAVNVVSTSSGRVHRGGSYGDAVTYLKCYYQDSGASGTTEGFRLVRRSVADPDPVPVAEISETFDGPEWTDSGSSGSWTLTAASGVWKAVGGNVYRRRDANVAYSGTGAILINNWGDSSYNLQAPHTTGLPVGVMLWARKYRSDQSASVSLQEYDGTSWRTTDSATISSTEYEKIRLNVVLTYPDSGQDVRLYGTYCYIDDLQVFTVPR